MNISLKIKTIVSPMFYDAIRQLKVTLDRYPNMTNQYFTKMPSMQDLYTVVPSDDNTFFIMPSHCLLDFLEIMGVYDEKIDLINDRRNKG